MSYRPPSPPNQDDHGYKTNITITRTRRSKTSLTESYLTLCNSASYTASIFPEYICSVGMFLCSFGILHKKDRRSRDRMVVVFTTIPMQSVPITTDVVSSNLGQSEVYNIM